jgi:hypothetical protein
MNMPLRWYHLIASSYGSWLHGDSRGFRTRHHREHVEGDYKNPPPPGMYADLEHRSATSLKRNPVAFPENLRSVVGEAMRDQLVRLGADVLCVAVSGQHAHLLAKLPEGQARHLLGLAKKHVWFVLREQGWKTQLWGKRGKEILIEDRQHQVNTYRYILDHVHEGAWVWSRLWKK